LKRKGFLAQNHKNFHPFGEYQTYYVKRPDFLGALYFLGEQSDESSKIKSLI